MRNLNKWFVSALLALILTFNQTATASYVDYYYDGGGSDNTLLYVGLTGLAVGVVVAVAASLIHRAGDE